MGHRHAIRSHFLSTLTTLETLALPAVVVLLTHNIGAFAAEGLTNGIKCRVPQGVTTRLYVCVDRVPDSVDVIDACLSAEKTTQTKRLDRTYKTLLGTLDDKANDTLVSSEQVWQDLHTKTATFETAIYGKGKPDDLQRLESRIFRLSECANTLGKYLVAKGH